MSNLTQEEIANNLPNVPKMPVCKKCNHEACPFCQDWCDTLANNKQEITEYHVNASHETNLDNKEIYPIFCCDGECTF